VGVGIKIFISFAKVWGVSDLTQASYTHAIYYNFLLFLLFYARQGGIENGIVIQKKRRTLLIVRRTFITLYINT